MSIRRTVDPERALKARAKAEKPLVWIGKNGITDETITQLDMFLKKKKLVKIRLLNSFVDSHDRKAAAEELAERTGSRVIDQIGFVVALYRR